MWKEECKNAPLGKGCLFCCLFWGTMHGPLSRDRVLAKERWFRDTQLQCCPLIEAQIPLYLLGSGQEPQPSIESSLHSSRLPQSGSTPLFEEKASQMLPTPTTCREAFNVLPGISILFLTPTALGLDTHPAFLMLGTPVGHRAAPRTAPWLRQDRCWEWPLRVDDSILTRLSISAGHGELP